MLAGRSERDALLSLRAVPPAAAVTLAEEQSAAPRPVAEQGVSEQHAHSLHCLLQQQACAEARLVAVPAALALAMWMLHAQKPSAVVLHAGWLAQQRQG